MNISYDCSERVREQPRRHHRLSVPCRLLCGLCIKQVRSDFHYQMSIAIRV